MPAAKQKNLDRDKDAPKCGCGLALIGELCRVHGANLIQTRHDPHLSQHIVAELRRMGKQYPALEALLPTLSIPAARDLLRALKDAKEEGSRTARAKLNRMGLGYLGR
jgi:hypothetical protein